MKEWTNGAGGLSALRWETKVIYTLYLLFSAAGFAVMGVLASMRSGWRPGAIAAYYIGDESIGLYGKTPAELLELTHFHLFAVPLFLFVTGHVFLLCRWRPGVKVGIVAAAFLGAAGLIAAPWLLITAGRGWAFLLLTARVLLAVPGLLFLAVPLWEMWRPARQEKEIA
ncbi:MAG: hypothetical protein ACYDCO_15230 [Armatimonadota bacterium]